MLREEDVREIQEFAEEIISEVADGEMYMKAQKIVGIIDRARHGYRDDR